MDKVKIRFVKKGTSSGKYKPVGKVKLKFKPKSKLRKGRRKIIV